MNAFQLEGLFTFGSFHNGINFHYEADNDEHWGKGDALKAVHFLFIEHIGIVAFSSDHEQKAQDHQASSNQHPHLVFTMEKRNGFFFVHIL